MKTQKLIPLLDYVLEQKTSHKLDKIEAFDKVSNYAKFLSQPLKLSMFVPVDKYGVIMQEPTVDNYMQPKEIDRQYETYNKAKSNVLFEGFEIETDMHYQTKREIIWMPNKIDQVWRRLTYHTGEVETYFFIHSKDYDTLESIIKAGLTLTENAVKTING